jgi:hypothetical protein
VSGCWVAWAGFGVKTRDQVAFELWEMQGAGEEEEGVGALFRSVSPASLLATIGA